jgi:hypothetical protein
MRRGERKKERKKEGKKRKGKERKGKKRNETLRDIAFTLHSIPRDLQGGPKEGRPPSSRSALPRIHRLPEERGGQKKSRRQTNRAEGEGMESLRA